MQVTCTDQVSPVHGIHEIKSRRPCLQSLTLFDFSLFYFSLLFFFFFTLFYFQKTCAFIEDRPSEKNVMAS